MKCAYSICLEFHPDLDYVLPSGVKQWVCSEECFDLATEEQNQKLIS